MLSFSRSFAIVAFASVGAAQSLSAQCTQTLAAIATNPDVTTCLTPSPLLAILSSGSSSIIGPINNWLTSLCAAPACSNATISAFLTNVTTGCSTEAAALGLQSDDTAAVAQLADQFYPTIRQVVCLKDGSTNCITETLTNIQTYTGPLTISNIGNLIEGNTSLNLPSNVTCTNCIKATYNLVSQIDSTLTQDLSEECGASFVNGQNATGITQSASSSVEGSSKGSSSSDSHAVRFNPTAVVSALLFMFGGFAFLA